MKRNLLHTPEGVRDIHSMECAKKMVLQTRIHDVLKLYGYSDIETPAFEFFDIFNQERGSVASNEMFKFFDRNGDTLVLRPDVTPSIARIAAKYFEKTDMPLKFCYTGNTYINNSSYQGRLKETTQIGAELIGDPSLEADAEIIAIVIDSLLNSGLQEFQVEIGQVQFFKGLLEESGITAEVEEELIGLILNKNYFGVEELLLTQNMDKKLADTLLLSPQLFGSVEVLKQAEALTNNEQSREAVRRLEELYALLQAYGYEKYITFDLGMISRHAYYTGVIFNAYTYGTGDSVVKGGRYDQLIGQFGTEKAAIGFSVIADQLMLALERQKIEIPIDNSGVLLLYTQPDRNAAVQLSASYRSIGTNVNMILYDGRKTKEEYAAYARAMNLGEMIMIRNGGEHEVYNICTGQRKTCKKDNGSF